MTIAPIQKAIQHCILFLALISLAACNQAAVPVTPTPTPIGHKTYNTLVVGFAQVGAESEWRTGNSESIQSAAESLGVELKFVDGQQEQENQIKAIRTFIAQQVDVIGVSPVVETGWDSVFQEAKDAGIPILFAVIQLDAPVHVFQEAKDAGIPIILVDRRADVPEELYATHLGSDFTEEGRNAARAMVKVLNGKGNIVEISGTQGSAPAIDRANGFREILKNYPDIKIIVSASGDFTRARGKEVMADLLKRYGSKIDAVFAHNDDMAIGAIKSIENAGLKPGQDIKIVSIDAIRDAFQAMVDGKLNATVECNPLLGPKFFELALQVANGETVPKWIPSNESVFYPDNAKEILPSRKY